MDNVTALLAMKGGKGQSGEVTAAAVLAALENMDDEQAEDALEAIGGAPESALAGYEPKPTVTEVSGATATISAAANTVYDCGELTSLTVDSFPASGKFWIWFTSGATPTTTVGIANFVAEANKKYRIFVEDGYASYDSWSVGGGS